MSKLAQQLWFTAPMHAEVRAETLPPLTSRQVKVAVSMSAVSTGTELLVYRGQVPDAMTLDATLTSLEGAARFPLRYGYACVGSVIECGSEVADSWQGQRVFAFQPHACHFVANADELLVIPPDVSDEAALFIPNMETAVNLVQDGMPQLGENIVVAGLGIVGVLLVQLLKQFPLDAVHIIEPNAQRRSLALQLGAASVSDPQQVHQQNELSERLGKRGADLLFEVSGNPAALDTLVSISGFCSRIVVGSWYGNKNTSLALGGAAHRNRLQLITSQVSTIAPGLTGRWDKARRFDLVWEQLRKLQPEQWIDARVPFREAPQLYRRLHEQTSGLQPIFIYQH